MQGPGLRSSGNIGPPLGSPNYSDASSRPASGGPRRAVAAVGAARPWSFDDAQGGAGQGGGGGRGLPGGALGGGHGGAAAHAALPAAATRYGIEIVIDKGACNALLLRHTSLIGCRSTAVRFGSL